MLNSVRDVVTSSNKQIATLEFISVESLLMKLQELIKNLQEMSHKLLKNY